MKSQRKSKYEVTFSLRDGVGWVQKLTWWGMVWKWCKNWVAEGWDKNWVVEGWCGKGSVTEFLRDDVGTELLRTGAKTWVLMDGSKPEFFGKVQKLSGWDEGGYVAEIKASLYLSVQSGRTAWIRMLRALEPAWQTAPTLPVLKMYFSCILNPTTLYMIS